MTFEIVDEEVIEALEAKGGEVLWLADIGKEKPKTEEDDDDDEDESDDEEDDEDEKDREDDHEAKDSDVD